MHISDKRRQVFRVTMCRDLFQCKHSNSQDKINNLRTKKGLRLGYTHRKKKKIKACSSFFKKDKTWSDSLLIMLKFIHLLDAYLIIKDLMFRCSQEIAKQEAVYCANVRL